MTVREAHAFEEVESGRRFAFGANWQQFLSCVSEERIREAGKSLRDMLGVEDVQGKKFIDIGSGSGLFSLAARRLGARVHSFDYDPQSVACTNELKRRYFPQDSEWVVEHGSALDRSYVTSLGKFDVVYSWGVLHHTGAMWEALDNVAEVVAPGGRLFIALYNDQGRLSKYWWFVKRLYNASPAIVRGLLLSLCLIQLWGPATLRDFALGRPFRTWTTHSRNRGMSPWRDAVDWVGGYPFEVSKPDDVFFFYKSRGFTLQMLKTCAGRHGCNEFVFEKNADGALQPNA